MLILLYKTTRLRVPEGGSLHRCSLKNLKFRKGTLLFRSALVFFN